MSAGGMAKYRLIRVTGDGAVSANPGRIMAVLLANGQVDSTVEFTDDADGNGTNMLEVSHAAEQGGSFFDFTSLGGIEFSSKCYADHTGGSMICYVWWDGN